MAISTDENSNYHGGVLGRLAKGVLYLFVTLLCCTFDRAGICAHDQKCGSLIKIFFLQGLGSSESTWLFIVWEVEDWATSDVLTLDQSTWHERQRIAG